MNMAKNTLTAQFARTSHCDQQPGGPQSSFWLPAHAFALLLLFLEPSGPLCSTARADVMPRITETNGVIRVEARTYRWEWSKTDDKFQIFDPKDRSIVTGKLQPEIVVQAVGGQRRSAVGRIAGH